MVWVPPSNPFLLSSTSILGSLNPYSRSKLLLKMELLDPDPEVASLNESKMIFIDSSNPVQVMQLDS